MSIAYITGGQYVPMVNAKLLARVIIGGVREEISLERLMQDAQEDINREMQQAEAEGADEQEITTRVNRLLSKKNVRVKQMDNSAGETSSIAKETYSKCADMRELRGRYVIEPTVQQAAYAYPTRAAVRHSLARRRVRGAPASCEENDEDEGSFPAPLAAPASASAEMKYDLREDEAVSISQTERIVQRMRTRK